MCALINGFPGLDFTNPVRRGGFVRPIGQPDSQETGSRVRPESVSPTSVTLECPLGVDELQSKLKQVTEERDKAIEQLKRSERIRKITTILAIALGLMALKSNKSLLIITGFSMLPISAMPIQPIEMIEAIGSKALWTIIAKIITDRFGFKIKTSALKKIREVSAIIKAKSEGSEIVAEAVQKTVLVVMMVISALLFNQSLIKLQKIEYHIPLTMVIGLYALTGKGSLFANSIFPAVYNVLGKYLGGQVYQLNNFRFGMFFS